MAALYTLQKKKALAASHTLRETKELMAQLSKADETDCDRLNDLINALAAVNMSYEVLVDSMVGKLVKPFKKHVCAKLAAAATALIKSWRVIANEHLRV